MIFQHQIVLLHFLWLGSFQVCTAAVASTELVGRLLGFPSSELVIEDVTVDERIILQTPSIKEKRRNAILPDPAVLLKAYLIRGKNENTFVPIQIYIGKREAFLNPELLVKVDNYTAGLQSKNPSWKADFESLGRGGMYFTGDHKVKPEVSGFKEPSQVAAEVILLQPHGQDFDVKIVMRPSLPMGAKLIPISGGEVYYSIYGALEDEKVEPTPDLAKAAIELSKTVIVGWLAEKSSNGVSSTPPSPDQRTTPSEPAPNAEQRISSPSSMRWPIVVAVIAAVLGLLWVWLKKRR